MPYIFPQGEPLPAAAAGGRCPSLPGRVLRALITSGAVLAAALQLCAAPAQAAMDRVAVLRAFEKAKASVGRRIGIYNLTDQRGRRLTLDGSSLERPIVVSYAYTSCGDTCPTILMELKAYFDEAGADYGTLFEAMTIGFDVERDTPERLEAYGRMMAGDFSAWTFVTADGRTMARLTSDLGFTFEPAPSGFDHPNMVTVIGRDGAVVRQLFGAELDRAALAAAIEEAAGGEGEGDGREAEDAASGGGPPDLIKFLCYTYDEETGTYRLDYNFLMSVVVGVGIQLFMIYFVIHHVFIKGSRRAARLRRER
ncbi:MAG TPA: SCO family protein [Deltaproteobacteria bacterium]|nr:SCO family protein [Deltaproteobacteria bacterium]